MLEDLLLSCCDSGRTESFFIHEPVDEKESLGGSGVVLGVVPSCFPKDVFLLRTLGAGACEVDGR